MVSINPKITTRVNLKLPNSGNGNEGNVKETGKNADENAKAVYVPGKSIGDIKPDVLLAYNGVTIGRPGQVVEPPKAEIMGAEEVGTRRDAYKLRDAYLKSQSDGCIVFKENGRYYSLSIVAGMVYETEVSESAYNGLLNL